MVGIAHGFLQVQILFVADYQNIIVLGKGFQRFEVCRDSGHSGFDVSLNGLQRCGLVQPLVIPYLRELDAQLFQSALLCQTFNLFTLLCLGSLFVSLDNGVNLCDCILDEFHGLCDGVFELSEGSHKLTLKLDALAVECLGCFIQQGLVSLGLGYIIGRIVGDVIARECCLYQLANLLCVGGEASDGLFTDNQF